MKITKILFGLGLFIAFAFLIVLFSIRFLNLQNPVLHVASHGNVTSNGIVNTSLDSQTSPIILTAQEVAKHNSARDCWMIVNNQIYDLTPLVYSHSGGSSTIIPDCGKDGSTGFNSKYGQGTHSSNANSILDSFYIGGLNQSIETTWLQNKTSAIANTTIPNSRGREDREND
jgi:cytochrome b involved in lipid metabolism